MVYTTPPLQQKSQFEAFSTSEIYEEGKGEKKIEWKKLLPENRKENGLSPTAFMTPTKRANISIDTSFDSSVLFDTPVSCSDDSDFNSTLFSPNDSLYGAKLPETPISPILSTPVMMKAIPTSKSLPEGNVLQELDDSIVSPDVKFSINRDKILGKGASSTVLECQANNETLAIKVPTNARKSKVIFKEMLNYKVIQHYLTIHGFDIEDFPILNAYGLTFMDKSQYYKLRVNETVPCLILPIVKSTLDHLIASSKPSKDELHIGANLWWKLAKQLIMVLIVLKDCRMVHMDFKPSNVLFDGENEEFKVADFTSAHLTEDILAEFQQKVEIGASYDLTLQYCAPELIDSPPAAPSYATDLFAVGLTLLSAAVGEEPYAQILQNHTASTAIYLNEAIKKNKSLDLLSQRALNILYANESAYKLIRMLITDRAPLESVTSFFNNNNN